MASKGYDTYGSIQSIEEESPHPSSTGANRCAITGNAGRNCLLRRVTATCIIAILITCLAVALITLPITLSMSNTSNKTSPYSALYTAGGNTTVLLGECLDPNLINQVNVKSDIDTIIYLVQKSEISSLMKHMYLPNKTIRTIENADDSLPVPVSYFDVFNPLYTAGEGGMMNYSVSLINNNMTRNLCALQLIVFDSSSDYFDYVQSERDPGLLPTNFYTNGSCVGENKTHNFNFELEANTFFFFVVSHVVGISFSVNASGNIPIYSLDLSPPIKSCKQPLNSSPCTFPLNQGDHHANRNDEWCLLGVSNNLTLYNVTVAIIPRSQKDYNTSNITLTSTIGLVFIILLVCILAAVCVYCYRQRRCNCKCLKSTCTCPLPASPPAQPRQAVSPAADIDEKVAHKVLATNNDLMTKIDLMYLADKMVEKGVMKDDTKRSIVSDRMTGFTEVERKNKLFDILKDTVAEDGSIFTWFIQILIDYDTRLSKSIAKKLKEKYDDELLIRTSS